MKVAFTICSNNYLAQASVLINSFKKFNPDFYFCIGLVDEFSEKVDYDIINADEIIPITYLATYGIEQIVDKYNIIELNTAIKPFVFKWIIEKFKKDVEVIYYLDPDLKFFSDINDLNNELKESSLILTPHVISPIPMDGFQPQEPLFLNYGLYNLGFLGLNPRHEQASQILDWWGERTFNIGYDDVCKGLFVDQLWMNFCPLFFKDVKVSFDKGLNMGPWNLHERSIDSIDGENVFLKGDEKLKFYHFSSYKIKQPEILAKYYDRYSFNAVGLLSQLYDKYLAEVLSNHIEKYSSIPCVYIKAPVVVQQKSVSTVSKISSMIARLLKK